jgi:hypothetical protein
MKIREVMIAGYRGWAGPVTWCQVGVFDRVRWACVWGGREGGAPGSVSALPV